MTLFFTKLHDISPEYHIALHSCAHAQREKIAALMCLFLTWKKRLKQTAEPMMFHIRLKWWYDQSIYYRDFTRPLEANSPPELVLLRNVDLCPLIEALSAQQDGYEALFQLISDIMSCTISKETVLHYADLYAQKEAVGNLTFKLPPLPKQMCFMRIPLILHHSHNFGHYLWLRIKNFFI